MMRLLRFKRNAVQYLAAKEGLQDKLSTVLSEEEAQGEASYWTGMAIKDYQVVKDAGGYDGNFEEFANQYFALNRLRILNYAQMNEKEADEIWKERLAETQQMSDEERYREEQGWGKLYSAAMYRSPLKDFGAFYDDVLSGKNKKPRFYTKTVDGVELDIPSNALHHDNNKHGLTKEEWEGILEAIDKNDIIESRLGDKVVMNGIPVKMIVDNNGIDYGVVFERMSNGRNLIQTAFKLEDRNWINERTPRWLPFTHNLTVVSLGRSMSDIINTLDKNVKGDNKLCSSKVKMIQFCQS